MVLVQLPGLVPVLHRSDSFYGRGLSGRRAVCLWLNRFSVVFGCDLVTRGD